MVGFCALLVGCLAVSPAPSKEPATTAGAPKHKRQRRQVARALCILDRERTLLQSHHGHRARDMATTRAGARAPRPRPDSRPPVEAWYCAKCLYRGDEEKPYLNKAADKSCKLCKQLKSACFGSKKSEGVPKNRVPKPPSDHANLAKENQALKAKLAALEKGDKEVSIIDITPSPAVPLEVETVDNDRKEVLAKLKGFRSLPEVCKGDDIIVKIAGLEAEIVSLDAKRAAALLKSGSHEPIRRAEAKHLKLLKQGEAANKARDTLKEKFDEASAAYEKGVADAVAATTAIDAAKAELDAVIAAAHMHSAASAEIVDTLNTPQVPIDVQAAIEKAVEIAVAARTSTLEDAYNTVVKQGTGVVNIIRAAVEMADPTAMRTHLSQTLADIDRVAAPGAPAARSAGFDDADLDLAVDGNRKTLLENEGADAPPSKLGRAAGAGSRS